MVDKQKLTEADICQIYQARIDDANGRFYEVARRHFAELRRLKKERDEAIARLNGSTADQ